MKSGDWIDLHILLGLDHHRVSWVTSSARWVETAGTSHDSLVWGIAIAFSYTILTKTYRPAIAAAVGFVAGDVISTLLKGVFNRDRPPAILTLYAVPGASFPSTHACKLSAASAALYFGARWAHARLRQPVKWFLIAANVIVGFCLIYLGTHWFSDVIVGWLLGIPIGAVIGKAFRGKPSSRVAHPVHQ